MRIRINADDFGISPGVNAAIENMYRKRQLHSASLIIGCGYLEEAIKISNFNPGLKVGLHFNLTTGFSVDKSHALLIDKKNRFKNGFLRLLFLSIFYRKKLVSEVEKELNAQINALKKCGVNIYHIDSHRHVHMIPAIFEVVQKIAKNTDIKNIRFINENFFQTFAIKYPKTYFFDGGIIKWMILRFFSFFIKHKTKSYFFSILYTCKISQDLISKIVFPDGYDETEIMVHPGDPDMDFGLALEEKGHLMSDKRRIENPAL